MVENIRHFKEAFFFFCFYIVWQLIPPAQRFSCGLAIIYCFPYAAVFLWLAQFHSDDKVMSEETCLALTKLTGGCTHAFIYVNCSPPPCVHTDTPLYVPLTAAVRSVMWPRAAGHTRKAECVTNKADIWDLTGHTVVCVCVFRALMSKMEEVSDDLRMHLWDTTTGELSYAHTNAHFYLYVTAAVCLHSLCTLHGCSVNTSLLPAEFLFAFCLHL